MNTVVSFAPKHLATYKNCHLHDTIVVCGCGHSLEKFKPNHSTITIGVNDVGRLFTPDYLVVLNSALQFKGNRFRYVETTQAKAVFTQLSLGIKHLNVVRFKLGQRGGTEIGGDLTVPYTRNSPYVALCLAMFMGAKRIGLIGVDFTDHHFFAQTGKHSLEKTLNKINQEYEKLQLLALKKGIQIVNLSDESRLSAFPKVTLEDFHRGCEDLKGSCRNITLGSQQLSVGDTANAAKTPLNIVSYSTMPVAGVPEILARCINRYTEHKASCVWQTNEYGNGVSFASATEWKTKPVEAKRLLAAADVVIVHNGKVAREHQALLHNKPVVTMAHNYLWNVDQQFVMRGMPGVVVGQYQAVLPEFIGWKVVANPIPDWDDLHKPTRKNTAITICYTPSGKHESYPRNHRLYWHSKGYDSTMAVLKKLAQQYPIELNVIRNKQLGHSDVLKMKQHAHIVIDECVTGSYHRNSLEGLACGCVVINGLDVNVEAVLSQCVGEVGAPIPFIRCALGNLEYTLTELIKLGAAELQRRGNENRLWLENHWCFSKQWSNQWWPVIGEAVRTCEARKVSNKSAGIMKTKDQNASLPMSTALAGVNPKKNKSEPLSVYWTCRNGKRGNFGDMLSPILTKALSARPVVFKQSSSRLFAVGSLLKFAKAGDVVWGSGFIHENDRAHADIDVRAVRGPLTRDILLRQGIECPAVYGDPGLLLPVIYNGQVNKKYEVGIIPHYIDLPKVKSMMAKIRKERVCIIDIRAGVEDVIKMTRQCEIILSSSLHGIILAEAYGIPAAWVEISDSVVGGGFKFRDYYASTNRNIKSLDWRKEIDLKSAIQSAVNIPAPDINLKKLVASFPFLASSRFDQFRLPEKRLDLDINNLKLLQSLTPESVVQSAAAEKKSSKIGKNVGRIAVYGAATENYVEFLVASLRSFIKHNGVDQFDYYILGNNFSQRTQRLMKKYNIRYVNVNLKNVFSRRVHSRYPSECFWIFKGPEIFSQLGYQYSLAIDGDTLCSRNLDLDWLSGVTHIAGVHRGCTNGEFLKNINQFEPLKHRLGLNDSDAGGPATNSGVLFFNNMTLSRLGFFQRVVDVFRRSENAGIPRAGDDSTLALVLALNKEIEISLLPGSWNLYRGLTSAQVQNSLIEEANIIHLSAMKPWLHHQAYPNTHIKLLIDEWRKFWPDTKLHRCVNVNARTIEPIKNNAISSKITDSDLPLNLYWYRGQVLNMGDEIAPYLVSQVLGLSPSQIPARPISDPAKSTKDVLISVGSVLRLSGKNTLVWGAGIRNIDQDVARAKRFCAVRGPITRRRLLELGYDCPEIYGDPAVLLPRYYTAATGKKYALGIVPHWVDYDQVKKHFGNNHGVLIIDVRTNNVESVIDQLNSCNAILSSSLHGIILSVSYGVPVRWLKISDRIMGDDCKFYDFFASLDPSVLDDFDFEKIEIINKEKWTRYTPLMMDSFMLNNVSNLDYLVDKIHCIENTLDVKRLLDAFPFESFRRFELSA